MPQPITPQSGGKIINPRIIHSEILRQHLIFSDIIFRQAMYETSWLKAPGFTVCNNLFGFMHGGKLMRFKFWEDSITHYKYNILKRWRGQDYYDFLNCMWIKSDGTCQRYAQSLEYTDHLKNLDITKPR